MNTDAINLADVYNPYDFANPVSDRKLFQGRDEEIREVNYYMRQAKAAPRPINLALIGERAAGKTSFLNIIAKAATDLSFCVASIDLNESDAHSPARLFFKIFDELLTAACDMGAFGGLTGRTYQTYRDIVDTGIVPMDTTFCPFAFPLQYAATRQHERAAVSDGLIKRDLRTIANELNTTSVLLFDECDVLSSSHVEIEQLRNVFMNSPGYMLVFAGTPRLFPVLDEVFSPIVRQFKKIAVGAYADIRGTRRCIEAPLEAIGLKFEDIVAESPWYLVNQVHEVSGGRPYEIQLLCHFMFKRMQLAQSSSGLDLTYETLEDVRRELESAHDVEVRPVLAAIKRLDNRELKSLGILTQASEHATLEQVASIEHVRDRETISEQALAHDLACLVTASILRIDAQGLICYNGDDFDRIYAKYFAKSRGESVAIRSRSLQAVMSDVLSELVSDGLVEIDRQLYVPQGYTGDVGKIALRLASGDASGLLNLPEYTATELATAVLEGASSGAISGIVWTCPWAEARAWFYGETDSLRANIEAMDGRARGEASTVVLTTIPLPVVQKDSMLAALKSLPAQGIRAEMVEVWSARAADLYLSGEASEANVDWLNCALYLYEPDTVTAGTCNNLGYMLLAGHRAAEAVPLFQTASRDDSRGSDKLMSLVNLCLAQLDSDSAAGALETWRRIEVHVERHPDHLEGHAACMMIPEMTSEGIVKTEQRDLLLSTAVGALRTVMPA